MTPSVGTSSDAFERPPLQPPPRNRMVVAVVSLMGVFVALYLLAYSIGLVPLICGVGSCETVQASQWAKVGPVPVPLIGVAGYGSLLFLALLGIQPSWAESRPVGLVMFGLAAVGAAYTAFLTYLEAAVIHAWCVWCVTSAVLMTFIFLATLPEVGRALKGRGVGA